MAVDARPGATRADRHRRPGRNPRGLPAAAATIRCAPTSGGSPSRSCSRSASGVGIHHRHRDSSIPVAARDGIRQGLQPDHPRPGGEPCRGGACGPTRDRQPDCPRTPLLGKAVAMERPVEWANWAGSPRHQRPVAARRARKPTGFRGGRRASGAAPRPGMASGSPGVRPRAVGWVERPAWPASLAMDSLAMIPATPSLAPPRATRSQARPSRPPTHLNPCKGS